jgi:hypothetical protein
MIRSLARNAVAALLLSAAVLAAYSDSFDAGFTMDNRLVILKDPRVHAWNAQNVAAILQQNYWYPAGYTNLYRPVATLTYLLNYSAPGGAENPTGYHRVNYLLHCINAWLVFWLLLRVTRMYWPSFFAALIWAVHPVATEAVTNIIGRADELAAMAVLGALLLYIRAMDRQGWRRAAWLAGVMLVTTLGLLSKENAVVIPALALLYDVTWRFKFVRPASLAVYGIFAAPLSAVWMARTAVFARGGPIPDSFLDNPLIGASFLDARLTAIRVIGRYFGLLVWPRKLSSDYSFDQVPVFGWRWETAAALAGLAAITVFAAFCYRRHRAIFFLVGFSAIALLPVSNLLMRIGSIMAERFLYLPAVGFAGCAALGIYSVCRRLRCPRALAPILLCAASAALGARTFVRNHDWKDDETLAQSAVQASPNSFKPYFALADYCVENRTIALCIGDAIAQAKKGMAIVSTLPDRLKPPKLYLSLGSYCGYKGDSIAGRDAAGNLSAGPESRAAYLEGLGVFREGARLAALQGHEVADLYENIGLMCLRLERPAEALEAFRNERRVDARKPESYRGAAYALLASGQAEGALVQLLAARLVQGALVSDSAILNAYERLPSPGCAIRERGLEKEINPDCPLVRRHICEALGELAAAHLDTVEASRRQYGCK